MVFLNPLSDIAFKKIFGNQANKSILISFLNSILNKAEGELIVDVTILDPYNNPDTELLKLSIVDVRCLDQRGVQYIVEVQARYQDFYPERSQYYASLAISRQLQKGAHYREIMPIIFIGVLGFSRFKSPEYISHHKILNTKTHEHALKHMEWHFIELTKFTKKLEDLQTISDKWLYLLANAPKLHTIPVQLQKPEPVEHALELLEEGKLSPQELAAYDRYLDALRVEYDVQTSAQRIGREEGIKEGIKEGEANAKRTIALQLLSKLSIEEVSHITGLSVQQLKKLNKDT